MIRGLRRLARAAFGPGADVIIQRDGRSREWVAIASGRRELLSIKPWPMHANTRKAVTERLRQRLEALAGPVPSSPSRRLH